MSLHDLRHGALTELASVSPNLPGIAHIAGHKRVSTTTQYVHSNRAQTRAVLNARPRIPVTIPVTDVEISRFERGCHRANPPKSRPQARVAELADALDLGSSVLRACRFESCSSH